MTTDIKEEFYTDNDIPIRFDILVDGVPVKPYSVSVETYGPGHTYLDTALIRPKKAEVFYKLNRNFVKEPGAYGAVFNCRLKQYGMHTEAFRFTVKENPKEDIIK